MTVTISTFIVLVVGYLLGSIPFAYLLARRHRGIDLRLAGSGNVGAANLLRTTTKKIGVSAMALDVAKGIASVLVARQIDPGATGPAVAGIAAVLGHIYPVWLGFRGGKGRRDHLRRVFDSRAAGDRDRHAGLSRARLVDAVHLARIGCRLGASLRRWPTCRRARSDGHCRRHRRGDRRCIGIDRTCSACSAGIERRLGQSA